MSRRGENIYKRKDGRWEGRYIIERIPRQKPRYGYVYAKTYHEAKEKLNAACRKHREESSIPEGPVIPPVTVREIASSWMEQKTMQVKPSTADKYRIMVERYINPALGNQHIEHLCRKDIEAYVNFLFSAGGKQQQGLSPKTISDVISILRSILSYAYDQGYSVHQDVCTVRIRQKPRQLRVLSIAEQKKLTDYLVGNLNLQNLGILFSLYTGIRIGEICALRWENISLQNGTVHICSTLQRLYRSEESSSKKTALVISTPKSQCSIRTIPLPEQLIQYLSVFEQSSGFFLTGNEAHSIEPRSYQNYFKRVLHACDVEENHYHILRHTFATRCVELDFDLKTLSEILGHSSVSITLNRYVHPSMELKKQHMNRLNALF